MFSFRLLLMVLSCWPKAVFVRASLDASTERCKCCFMGILPEHTSSMAQGLPKELEQALLPGGGPDISRHRSDSSGLNVFVRYSAVCAACSNSDQAASIFSRGT